MTVFVHPSNTCGGGSPLSSDEKARALCWMRRGRSLYPDREVPHPCSCAFMTWYMKVTKLPKDVLFLNHLSLQSLEEASFWDNSHTDQFDEVCGVQSFTPFYKGMGVHTAYDMGSLHVLEGIMNAERYIKVLGGNICSPSDDVYFREGLVYFSRTMQNHILQLLQQHRFVLKESRCWVGLPAVRIGASLNKKYIKEDHKLFSTWKPISGKNGTKLQHQNSRNS